MVEAIPIGVVRMLDQGFVDEKIISVCSHDPFYSCYKDIFELPQHVFDEIKHFFQVYKTLEGKQTIVTSVENNIKAKRIIANNIERYKEKFKR